MHSGERQFHLRLHATCPRNTAVRAGRQIIHERRLAHARCPAYDERPALTGTNGVDESVEDRALVATPDQLARGAISGNRADSHNVTIVVHTELCRMLPV